MEAALQGEPDLMRTVALQTLLDIVDALGVQQQPLVSGIGDVKMAALTRVGFDERGLSPGGSISPYMQPYGAAVEPYRRLITALEAGQEADQLAAAEVVANAYAWAGAAQENLRAQTTDMQDEMTRIISEIPLQPPTIA